MNINREKVRKAAKIISETKIHKTELGVADILDEIGMNGTAFKRHFKAVHGMSARKYLITKKIEAAMSMFKDDSHSIKTIAIKLGYSQVSGFVRVFKDYTGATPGETRRRILKESQTTVVPEEARVQHTGVGLVS